MISKEPISCSTLVFRIQGQGTHTQQHRAQIQHTVNARPSLAVARLEGTGYTHAAELLQAGSGDAARLKTYHAVLCISSNSSDSSDSGVL